MVEATPEEVKRHLDKLLASEAFAKSGTHRRLLSYLVERSLQGGDGPKETEIAIDVFSRDASFNGAEESVVRVTVRTLRQKLVEYYAGPGKHDQLVFDIPKGAYRLSVITPHTSAIVEPVAASDALALAITPRSAGAERRWAWTAIVALALLAVSLTANLYWWNRQEPADPVQAQVRKSALWSDLVESNRPVMFVLGDLFMYTQTDPKTGRTQSVRDTQINSSEDLRAFLASNPELAAERGLRYSSVVQKSAALGMASMLPIVSRPGRRVEVRLRDELLVDDLRTYDIIYLGPLARLGPLAGHYQMHSRYRFDQVQASITNVVSGKSFLPEGELGEHHKDYALAARFPGPGGNTILIVTSGGRNAGLQQMVRTLTSPEGLQGFERKMREAAGGVPNGFEALLSVTGYKQTDLAAEVVELQPFPAPGSKT
jgi:hypothetical protein